MYESDTIMQWAQFQPTITVIVLGQQDLLGNKLMRDRDIYTHWAQSAIKELVEAGRKFRNTTEDKLEYDYRMRWEHRFLLATPRCLMERVSHMQLWEYDRLKTAATEAMVQKRKDFYMDNIIVFRLQVTVVEDIRKAVSKLLCLRCRASYSSYGMPVKHFEQGGCDDPRGASLLMDRRQGESP